MSNKLQFLTTLTLILPFTLSLNFTNEFERFSCKVGQPSISINLNFHPELKFPGIVSFSFWFKFKGGGEKEIFSINNLLSDLRISLNYRNRIMVNNEIGNLNPLIEHMNLEDFKTKNGKGWNFFYFYFKSEKTRSSSFDYLINLNYQNEEMKKKNLNIDLKEFFVTLGSDKKNSNCKMDILFYKFNLYDNVNPFSEDEIRNFSFGFAEPVFLSKFDYESSYNKIYSNLINSGVGDILNGADQNNFGLFTSLSTKNNSRKIKANLTNALSIFFLPQNMLPFYEINNSCVFLINFNFFFKDISKNIENNKYYHVLYQRFPKEGVDIKLRADLQINITPLNKNILIRYFINTKIKKQIPFDLPTEGTNQLKEVPFNFILVKVEQNALNKVPKVTYINGYNMNEFIYKENFALNSEDQHLIGDSVARDSTRKEFITFVEILEVSFLRGGFFRQDSDKFSPFLFFSGMDNRNLKFVMMCKEGNNLKRNREDVFNSEINLLSCDDFVKEVCEDVNCDVCEKGECVVCDEGYEIGNLGNCERCLKGYDPILKVCFDGIENTEFFTTQFANLNVSLLDVEFSKQYFLSTLKFRINKEQFLHNGFFYFFNNVDDENRLVDVCWDDSCLDKDQEIYFAFANTGNQFKIEKFIFGNSGIYTIDPISITYYLQNQSAFLPSDIKHKNFNCSFLGNYYFLELPTTTYYGTCVETCPKKYFKNFQSQKCEKCAKSCKTCQSALNCLSCLPSETLIQGQCLKCQKPCLTCSSSPNTCLTCTTSEMFYENKCDRLCRKKNSDCLMCDIYNGNCLKCKKGFILKGVTCEVNSCKLADCKICLDSNNCRVCESGFLVRNGGCRVCDRGCEECPFGYLVSKGKVCVRDESVVILEEGESSSRKVFGRREEEVVQVFEGVRGLAFLGLFWGFLV